MRCAKEGDSNHDGGQYHHNLNGEEEGRNHGCFYFDDNEKSRYLVVLNDDQEACDEEGFRDRSIAKSLAVRDSVNRARRET